ncbi:MAG: 2-C-methyl-D-erythritol 2,4-cyclodiphosphate synthase [bacterium]|jgi:2-C-methyl-D-erythritol 2,4-cyclodiphosphate synthase|nr:2-C-methyl-D-erythritol 2,4-cyclodiphosphate synthase [Coprothermobacterota bacterium]
MRIGLGIDVHPYATERPLILCGITLSNHGGLGGHSDGDVCLHALMDAILGAVGEEDIGVLFPATEERKGSSSLVMLEQVAEMVAKTGLTLLTADIALVMETPKIAPYRVQMRTKLQSYFPLAALHIKATTCEGLGFIGRGEGVAALAVALVGPP